MTKLQTAIQALEDIVDPIGGLKRNMGPGDKLDDDMAEQLYYDAAYLRELAKDALKIINKPAKRSGR